LKNKDLKKIYNKAFLKGEEKHFTRRGNDEKDDDFFQVVKIGKWKGKKVLDVGCGTGRLVFLLAKKGATCTGVDYSKEAIEIAKEKFEHPNLMFKELDASEQISGKYDVIISIGTLEHQDEPLSALKLYKKHLNPKGKIIITSPNWTNPRGYILMSLYYILNAPITLADLHYFTPKDFETWGKILKMKLDWKTFDESWGHGKIMIEDLSKRLPKILEDMKIQHKKKDIKKFLNWLEEKALPLEQNSSISGATGMYIFQKK